MPGLLYGFGGYISSKECLCSGSVVGLLWGQVLASYLATVVLMEYGDS